MKKLLLLVALPLALVSGAFAQNKKPNTASSGTAGKRTVVEMVANSPEHSTLVEAVKTAGLAETLRGTGPFTIFAPTNKAFAKLADDLDWDKEHKYSNQTGADSMTNRTWDTTMQNRPMNPTRDTMMQNRPMQDTMTTRTSRDTTLQNQPIQDTLGNRSTNTATTTNDTTPNSAETLRKANAVLKPENQENLKTILNYHVVRGSFDSKALAQAVKTGNGKTQLTTVQGEKLTVTMQGNDFVLEDARGAKARVTTADLRGSNGVIHVIDQVALPKKENTMER